MCSLGLWNVELRLGLASVDQVNELDPILDEEDRNVVANNVPVALFSVWKEWGLVSIRCELQSLQFATYTS